MKAKLLGLPLVDLLGAAKPRVPAYGSGGINTATWNLYDLQKGSYSPFNIGYADADRMVRDYDSIDGLTIPMTPRALLGSGVK